MQIVTATWRNGHVELLEGVDWAEGTQLRVAPVAATQPDQTDWHVQNARRLELISKEVHAELSDEESGELERLQNAAAKVCEPDDRRRLAKLAEIEARVEQLTDEFAN
jgi:hypothetical protein